MRHIALAALLAAPAAAADSDALFAQALQGIRASVVIPDGAAFVPADWVDTDPRRTRILRGLDREQAYLYQQAAPATFIVRMGQRGQEGHSTGSGFFIHPDGTGLTNVHVVGATVGAEVDLETVRGPKRARVLAVAPGRDIAIIKVIDESRRPFADWQALRMGTELLAGQNVFAIGNPADQGSTFTRGIASRPRQDQRSPWVDFLQLDIALNPGNSGGVLIDSSGRVAGMNAALLSGGGIAGIGFAIPVQDLVRARAEYAASGKLEDPVSNLGVVGDEMAVIAAPGVVGQAGFRLGDAIVSFPGSDGAVPGNRAYSLYRAVGHMRPGQTVPIQVSRSVPCTMHTSATAGAAPVASAAALCNPATGVVIVPDSLELMTYLLAITPTSVEELEYSGARYATAAVGRPAPFGMMFRAQAFPLKVLATEALNLPVEVYAPAPEGRLDLDSLFQGLPPLTVEPSFYRR